ncbi:MAG: astB [Verrucomicrobia bacterium]|nr:astB [Verrucomicrobiota bacterium]
MKAFEVNFDGLVGPTHNYAGLSRGNVASMAHRGRASNPRAAALQGLAKMKFLADLGLKQAVLPPHERPSIPALRDFGFGGRDEAVLRAAARSAPELLVACSSASAMWVANAATVAPSSDTVDGRVHFTPANLVSKLHRSIEADQTARTLRSIFHDANRFVVHAPVAGGQGMGDEGAANHSRLCGGHGKPGLHFFVYGHRVFGSERTLPGKFPSRQAREASEAVVRLHGLSGGHAVLAQQSPVAIDAGVFHHDVIGVANENVLLFHENAYADGPAVIAELARGYRRVDRGGEFFPIRVPAKQVPLAAAVSAYLFNSQLVTLAPGKMALIAPVQCAQHAKVRGWIEQRLERKDTPIREAHFLDLRQSMRNGGGPACLRLRVVLTEAELAALPAGVRFDDGLHAALVNWVGRHYRDSLKPSELADPKLLAESRAALDELTQILGLGSIYPFQR